MAVFEPAPTIGGHLEGACRLRPSAGNKQGRAPVAQAGEQSIAQPWCEGWSRAGEDNVDRLDQRADGVEPLLGSYSWDEGKTFQVDAPLVRTLQAQIRETDCGAP